MAPDEWSHEALLEAEPVSAGLARDFVSRHLHAHQLPHLVDTVCLVASELATNAVIHARTPFTLRLSCTDRRLLLSVRDQSTAALIRSARQVMNTTGRGLFLVELLSEEWGTSIDPHGLKTVWASFTAEPE